MVKTYVSIMNLLPDIVKYKTEDMVGRPSYINNIYRDNAHIFEVTKELVSVSDEIEPKPVSQDCGTEQAIHPLDRLRETIYEGESNRSVKQNENTTQILRYVKPTRRFSTGVSMCIKENDNGEIALPYILEIEYLRYSDFRFTTRELEVMDRLFALYICEWLCLTKLAEIDETLEPDEIMIQPIPMTVDLIDELRRREKLMNIDLPETVEPQSEVMGQMYQIMKQAYRKFTIGEELSPAIKKGVLLSDYGLAVSSIDAFKTIGMRLKTANYDSKIYAESILFMPIIAIFHLLECETQTIKTYTIDEYLKYKNAIDDHLLGDWDIEDDIQATECSFEEDGFSFGVCNHYNNGYGDRQLIFKITGTICQRLEEIVSKNISIISIDKVKNIQKGHFQILLNTDTLNWITQAE